MYPSFSASNQGVDGTGAHRRITTNHERREPLRRPGSWWISRTTEAIGIGVLCIGFAIVPAGASSTTIALNLVIFYAVLARSLVLSDRIGWRVRTNITIESLFLIFSLLVFYLPYQLYLLGLSDIDFSRFLGNTYPNGTNRAIILSSIGILSFVFFYRLIARPGQSVDDTYARVTSESNFRALTATTALILVGLISLYLSLGWRTAGEGRYSDSENGGILAEGVSQLIVTLAMISLALYVCAIASRYPLTLMTYVGVAASLFWLIRAAGFGDRNNTLLLLLVLAGGLFTFRWRMPLFVLALSTLFLLALYNISEIVRMPTGSIPANANYLDYIVSGAPSSQGDESSFNITTMTVRASVETVPSSIPFQFGYFKVIGILGIFPFSRGLFQTLFPSQYSTSADLLGNVMLGPSATWNVGSNVISDSYLDFGVVGVIIILGILGALGALLRNSVAARPHDPARIAMYLLALALLAETPRYSADFAVRSLVWAAMFLVVVQHLSARRRGSRGRLRHRESTRSTRLGLT
jgi:oligosaccharide repeat unit polymerase